MSNLIGGAGFAMMAWQEAQRRANDQLNPPPMRMGDGSPCCKVCAEYFCLVNDAWDSFSRLTTYAKMNWEPRITL